MTWNSKNSPRIPGERQSQARRTTWWVFLGGCLTAGCFCCVTVFFMQDFWIRCSLVSLQFWKDFTRFVRELHRFDIAEPARGLGFWVALQEDVGVCAWARDLSCACRTSAQIDSHRKGPALTAIQPFIIFWTFLDIWDLQVQGLLTVPVAKFWKHLPRFAILFFWVSAVISIFKCVELKGWKLRQTREPARALFQHHSLRPVRQIATISYQKIIKRYQQISEQHAFTMFLHGFHFDIHVMILEFRACKARWTWLNKQVFVMLIFFNLISTIA